MYSPQLPWCTAIRTGSIYIGVQPSVPWCTALLPWCTALSYLGVQPYGQVLVILVYNPRNMCLVTLEYSPQLTRCTAPGYLGVLAEQDALLHGLEDHEGDKEEHVGAHQGPEPRRHRLSDGRPRRPLAPRQRRDQNHRQDQSQNLWNGHG